MLFLLALMAPALAAAESLVHWEVTLDSAKRVAAQSNRLVLIHFWAPWCGACRAMESEVYSQPNVVAALSASYVPVKVNVEFFQTLAERYHVTGLPTIIIIRPTAQGEVIDAARGRLDAIEYVSWMNRVAMRARPQRPVYAQIPPRATLGPPEPPTPGPAYSGPTTSVAMNDRYGADASRSRADSRVMPVAPTLSGAPRADRGGPPSPPTPSVAVATLSPPISVMPPPPTAVSPVVSPPAPAAPPLPAASPANHVAPMASASAATVLPEGSLPLGLDGFCPVLLSEKSVWQPGDRAWGAKHRGRTYLFAGREEQQRFLADPDRYAPVMSGNDVVLAVSEGRLVPGQRAHGLQFASRVFLFADEENLQKFTKDPTYYADRASLSTQTVTAAGPPMR
jgi:thiol-disulfide isomerase/thioredoxin/YHS domain-containing protein